MRRELVDLSELAESVAEGLSQRDPERRVSMLVEPGLEANGDPQLLKIALENLLGNAWKFTGRSASPKVEFGKAEWNGKQALFVRDNGVGFDMSESEQLFKPFQRLASTSGFPGTGLGLAIVSRIVHRHGGWVRAEGSPGKGATFYFTL